MRASIAIKQIMFPLGRVRMVGLEPTMFSTRVSDFKSDAFRQFRHTRKVFVVSFMFTITI